MFSNKIIFIVGPTAVGKSDVAVCLAKRIDGEIVSCDSMQVYREINIASNKPSQEMMSAIPHHLIDVASIEEKFDVVLFNKLALCAIKEIHKKKKIPIVVGGSGLYAQVLLDGIFEGASVDEDFRKSLRRKVEEEGEQTIYQLLVEKDPQAAEKIHPNDIKKVIRALEVIEVKKQPMSELQKKREGLWGKYDINIYGLAMDRKVLYEKINKRVDVMFEEGVSSEIKNVLQRNWSYTAQGLIGYKEIKGYCQGDCNFDEAKSLMKRNTRHFAKRQFTWFRHDDRIKWMTTTHYNSVDKIAETIVSGI